MPSVHGSGDHGTAESLFRGTLLTAALVVTAVVCVVLVTLIWDSLPSIRAGGLRFLTGTTWDPVFGVYGALPFIVGTLLTSFLAIALSAPFSLAISLYLGEYRTTGPLSSLLRTFCELLAGIPSVIYGLWGLFVLVPLVRSLELHMGASPYGVGICAASMILSIMVIPYSASMGREVITMVPSDIKEAAYSLGATRYEVVKNIILPYARSGIYAGILLALGRALGETMAVTMVIGNSNYLPRGIFSPGNTMASVIANEFTEATGNLYLSALIEIGLLLFIVTMVINMAGTYIIKKAGIA